MKQLHVNLSPELLASIRDAAEREHETLSVWVRRVLREAVRPPAPHSMPDYEFTARKEYADEFAVSQSQWWELFYSAEAVRRAT